MDQETLFCGIIKRLIGVKMHVHVADITPRRTIGGERRQRQTTLGLSFEDPRHQETIAKKWAQYVQERSFSEPFELAFTFCEWYRKTGGI